MSNPINHKTTTAPSNNEVKEISSRMATQAPTGAIEMASPNQKCENAVKRLVKE